MSDAIKAGAEALHRTRQSACNHHTGGPAECDSQAMTVLDAATLDAEAMARVLDPDSWRLHDDPRYDHLPQQARDSLVGKSLRDARAIRDWMLGGEG